MKKVVWSAKALVAAKRAKALVAAKRVKALVAATLMVLAIVAGGTSAAAWQQQPPAAPDGFVPVDNLPQQEQLPAAPLVMAAYAVAWVAVFGYLWSIWRRLGSVERDILEVSRRIETGSRR